MKKNIYAMTNRYIVIAITLVMCLTLIPVRGFAENTEPMGESVCECETICIEDEANMDCPICTANVMLCGGQQKAQDQPSPDVPNLALDETSDGFKIMDETMGDGEQPLPDILNDAYVQAQLVPLASWNTDAFAEDTEVTDTILPALAAANVTDATINEYRAVYDLKNAGITTWLKIKPGASGVDFKKAFAELDDKTAVLMDEPVALYDLPETGKMQASLYTLRGFVNGQYGNIPSPNTSIKLTKSGSGALALTGNNAWFNGELSIAGGSVTATTYALPGGIVSLAPGTQLLWQDGAQVDYHRPQITMLGDASLHLRPSTPGGAFNMTAGVVGELASQTHIDKSEMKITADCSLFRGTLTVEQGANFYIRKSSAGTASSYMGVMFGGEYTVVDQNGVAAQNGEIIVASNSGLKPMTMSVGIMHVLQDTEGSNQNNTPIDGLNIGAQATVNMLLKDVKFSDTVVAGKLQISSPAEGATFDGLSITGGTIEFGSKNLVVAIEGDSTYSNSTLCNTAAGLLDVYINVDPNTKEVKGGTATIDLGANFFIKDIRVIAKSLGHSPTSSISGEGSCLRLIETNASFSDIPLTFLDIPDGCAGVEADVVTSKNVRMTGGDYGIVGNLTLNGSIGVFQNKTRAVKGSVTMNNGELVVMGDLATAYSPGMDGALTGGTHSLRNSVVRGNAALEYAGTYDAGGNRTPFLLTGSVRQNSGLTATAIMTSLEKDTRPYGSMTFAYTTAQSPDINVFATVPLQYDGTDSYADIPLDSLPSDIRAKGFTLTATYIPSVPDNYVAGNAITAQIEAVENPADTENPKNVIVTTAVAADRNSPKTGDEANMSLWIALCIMAGVAIVGVATYRRRKARQE